MVVDSELRLRLLLSVAVVVAVSVSVVVTAVVGKVWIGPPGMTLDTSESVVSGSDTAAASAWPARAAEGARRRGRR